MSITGNVSGSKNLSGGVSQVLGLDGKSAYELAVEEGFEGTLEEWLASLHGKDYILTEEDKAELQAYVDGIAEVANSAKNESISAKDSAIAAQQAAIGAVDEANSAMEATDRMRNEAADSAMEATTAYLDAETAKDEAEAAKSDAISAKTSAEKAKSAAETAKAGAETAKAGAELASSRYPYVGENGNWYVFDSGSGSFVDSGAKAQGPIGDKGDKGDKGDTPEKGVDYFTPLERQELVESVLASLPVYEGEVL